MRPTYKRSRVHGNQVFHIAATAAAGSVRRLGLSLNDNTLLRHRYEIEIYRIYLGIMPRRPTQLVYGIYFPITGPFYHAALNWTNRPTPPFVISSVCNALCITLLALLLSQAIGLDMFQTLPMN